VKDLGCKFVFIKSEKENILSSLETGLFSAPSFKHSTFKTLSQAKTMLVVFADPTLQRYLAVGRVTEVLDPVKFEF
jgi:hypothetical protein